MQPKHQNLQAQKLCKPKATNVQYPYKHRRQVILAPVTTEFKDGDTVFDVLKKITREKGIQMEVSGASSNIYVKGIDNLYEFDKGAQSRADGFIL